MGHFCRICGRVRPNEKFSGKGHKTHVCKECHRLPKDEREKIDLESEFRGYLKQSRISKKNVKRLQELTGHSDPEVAKRAELLIRVAKIAEGKRKRWRRVSQADKALLFACGEAGLLEHWIPEDEYRASRALCELDDGPEGWGLEEGKSVPDAEDSRRKRDCQWTEDLLEEEEIPF